MLSIILFFDLDKIIKMNSQQSDKKSWLQLEDKMIVNFVNSDNTQSEAKIRWSQIANLINKQFTNKQRTGKQCRERWLNQLNPTLKKDYQWTQSQEQRLFALHEQLGNKWALIANNLQGRTDNCVKNHLHSTLRKGIRKLNKYISENKLAFNSMKPFKPILLNKLLAVVDGKYQQKLQVKKEALQISLPKRIKNHLIQISRQNQKSQEQENQEQKNRCHQIKRKIVQQIQLFNRNCKRRKGKMKKINQQKQQVQFLQSHQSEYSSTNKLEQQIIQGQGKQPQQPNQIKIVYDRQQFQDIQVPNFPPSSKEIDILMPQPIIYRQNSQTAGNMLNNSSKLFSNNLLSLALQKSNGSFQNYQTGATSGQIQSSEFFNSQFLSGIGVISKQKNDEEIAQFNHIPSNNIFQEFFPSQFIKSIDFGTNPFILSGSIQLSQLSQLQKSLQQSNLNLFECHAPQSEQKNNNEKY